MDLELPKKNIRIDLNVPFSEKEDAKALGAKWDPAQKNWFVVNCANLETFKKWIPDKQESNSEISAPISLVKSKETKENIINYWRAIEFFSPQKIPKAAPKHKTEPVFEIYEDDPLFPWENLHPLKAQKYPNQLERKYIVYCGVYPHSLIKESLEKVFGKDETAFDERIDGDGCVFAFTITNQGRPLFDSFILSSSAWALAQIMNNKGEKLNCLDKFDEEAKRLSLEFSTYCKIDEEDVEGLSLINQGHNVGKCLNGIDLFHWINRLVKTLKLNLENPLFVRAQCYLVNLSNMYKAEEQNFLNSFYIEDLKKVSKAVKSKDVGQALNAFLSSDSFVSSQKRIDIRQDSQHEYDMLAPFHFPSGRWPSVGHYPLVLSQQFAVNSIFNTLKNNDGGIFAVNGPPGTGKTTLLRDVIANIIVERAKCLARFNIPSQVFSKETVSWKSEKYSREIALWPKEFENFSIVVASSNNAAVENITYEIPGESAIDSSWELYTDYFSSISTLLIEKPAWSLIAARLGNKANRSDFIQKFWYGDQVEKDNSDGVSSFLTLLKEYQYSFNPDNWRTALASFKKAQRDEEKIRKERINWHALLQTITLLEKDQLNVTIRKSDALQIQQQIEQEFSEKNRLYSMAVQEFSEYRNKRIEHHQFRPKLIDIVFTLGKAYKVWRLEDHVLCASIKSAERELSILKKTLDNLSENLNNWQKTDSSLTNELLKIEKKLSQSKKELNKLNQIYSVIPNFKTWTVNYVSKELSSPWADEAWNKARTVLFLEALNLHRAFIQSNAGVFRKNMHAVIDILSGGVPKDAPKEGTKAAWLTLFFVIPVISTTFASLSHLFKHLNKEDLGWLLIDEAGQATPQSAIGAIWRAKKVIVVGDPLQLEPIVTLPFTAQMSLRQHFKVSESWIPQWSSLQILADRVTSVGTLLPYNDSQLWVGSPLRVHRRCDNPMFSISNQIAYDGLMVFGTSKRTPFNIQESCWFDIVGQAIEGHFIPEEGRQLIALLRYLIRQNVIPKNVFVISPFKQVVNELYQYRRLFPDLNIGTIHTTQGKEAEIVILVLGGNTQKLGAKKWASERPNLLNVAVSRAKRRLYVIGNRASWKKFNYFDVLAKDLPVSKIPEEVKAGELT